jgi:hypothetical protein
MAKMNTEGSMTGRDKSGPLPDYDHRTRLLVVGAVVLDRAYKAKRKEGFY